MLNCYSTIRCWLSLPQGGHVIGPQEFQRHRDQWLATTVCLDLRCFPIRGFNVQQPQKLMSIAVFPECYFIDVSTIFSRFSMLFGIFCWGSMQVSQHSPGNTHGDSQKAPGAGPRRCNYRPGGERFRTMRKTGKTIGRSSNIHPMVSSMIRCTKLSSQHGGVTNQCYNQSMLAISMHIFPALINRFFIIYP